MGEQGAAFGIFDDQYRRLSFLLRLSFLFFSLGPLLRAALAYEKIIGHDLGQIGLGLLLP